MPKQRTALITGASGGIGLALASVFAKHGYNIVLVARNEEKLKAVKSSLEKDHKVLAYVIPADLLESNVSQLIFQKAKALGLEIDVLVNNAGFAEYGLFADAELKGQLGMIALNIAAPTELTHLFLKDMILRKSGSILNVASTAAFQPGPLMAVYYASKAYVLSFSEGIRNEVKGYGIAVTALCPGPTKTDFFAKQPKMKDSRLINSVSLMSADEVAETGYHALMKNKAVAIPGLMNKLLAFSTRFSPRSLTTQISRWTLEKK
jgi:short-subunit dehydrogenase